MNTRKQCIGRKKKTLFKLVIAAHYFVYKEEMPERTLTCVKSLDKEGNQVVIKGKGRHDPCVLPRAVPIVDAMLALTLVDHILRNKTAKL